MASLSGAFTTDMTDASERDGNGRDAVELLSIQAPRRVHARRNKRINLGRKLESFDAMPDYLRGNEFIQRHYRQTMPMRDSFRSLFGLHNETGNIYTHLLGFLLFASLTVYIARAPPAPLTLGNQQHNMLWSSLHGSGQLPGSPAAGQLPRLPGLQQLQGLTHSLSQGLCSIQEGLSGGAHSVQEGLSQSLHGLQQQLQGLQHSLSEGAHNVQHCLSQGVHSLQEGLWEGLQALQADVADVAHLLHKLQHSLCQGLLHDHHDEDITTHSDGQAGHETTVDYTEAASQRYNLHAITSPAGAAGGWPTPRWPAYVFMAGAMTCLLLSSVCHLLGCCQMHITKLVWRLDYAGIAILIVSSFYPPVYYGFMCHKPYLIFYLASTTAMGLMAVLVSLMDKFQAKEWRVFRASMFAALGLYGAVPILHLWLMSSDIPQVKLALTYDLAMGATYLIGAAIYAQRIPERWFPGMFDLFFHSHQIFHIAVVAGAFIHYFSVKLMLEWRDASGGCAAPVTSGPVVAVLHQVGQELLGAEEAWGRLQHFAQQLLLGPAAANCTAKL